MLSLLTGRSWSQDHQSLAPQRPLGLNFYSLDLGVLLCCCFNALILATVRLSRGAELHLLLWSQAEGCIVGKELRWAVGECLMGKACVLSPSWSEGFSSPSLPPWWLSTPEVFGASCEWSAGSTVEKAWTSRGEGPQHFRDPALLMMCKIGLYLLGACFTVLNLTLVQLFWKLQWFGFNFTLNSLTSFGFKLKFGFCDLFSNKIFVLHLFQSTSNQGHLKIILVNVCVQ